MPTAATTPAPTPAAGVAPPRYPLVDALRGLAMVWMTLFHFSFDLSHFGYWPQDFRADPFWTVQRTAIVSLFLLCAGLGQALAWQHGLSWGRFARRWAQIAGCAALVTLGSWLMFPQSFIFFGVLHGMAVMLVLVRASAGWGRWLWLAGLLALLSPWVAQALLLGPLQHWDGLHHWLNSRAGSWLGWVTRKPYTEDYVPLFPWLGVMCWGMALGQWLLASPQRRHLGSPLPQWLTPLARLGRYSLAYYMLHQPVLIGGLLLWGWLRGL